jgi:aminoglycoside N3'-acetyltransferase
MTATGTLGVHSSMSRLAVVRLTQMTALACLAATLMARRKKGTLARWCHSGWSKKVRSWTVTILGMRALSGIV